MISVDLRSLSSGARTANVNVVELERARFHSTEIRFGECCIFIVKLFPLSLEHIGKVLASSSVKVGVSFICLQTSRLEIETRIFASPLCESMRTCVCHTHSLANVARAQPHTVQQQPSPMNGRSNRKIKIRVRWLLFRIVADIVVISHHINRTENKKEKKKNLFAFVGFSF